MSNGLTIYKFLQAFKHCKNRFPDAGTSPVLMLLFATNERPNHDRQPDTLQVRGEVLFVYARRGANHYRL
jgi:hypothetical protein